MQALGLSACADLESLASFGRDSEPREVVYHNGVVENELGTPLPPVNRNLVDTNRYEDGTGLVVPVQGYRSVEREFVVENDNVDVYSLDDPIMASRALPRGEGGIPALSDPDVTVYPFDGDQYDTPYTGPMAELPGLSPPSEQRPAFPSPFAQSDRGPVLQPPPARTGYSTLKEKVYFQHDSSTLDSQSRKVLTSVADEAADSGVKITVEGHASKVAESADPKEKDIINLKKSMDRAYSVSSTLIRKGVPIEKLKTCAYGDSEPPSDLDGKDINAASRRVEVRTGY
jgi:outer membrane protein OmpA-like peptidoglycan-associated protein